MNNLTCLSFCSLLECLSLLASAIREVIAIIFPTESLKPELVFSGGKQLFPFYICCFLFSVFPSVRTLNIISIVSHVDYAVQEVKIVTHVLCCT